MTKSNNNPNKGLKSIPSYIKNVTKSTMYAGGDFLGDIMPATKSFSSSNSSIFKTISYDMRNFRTITKQVGRQMGQSEMYTTAKKYKNNLAEDLKSGNWYNKTRDEKYALDSSGFGDLFDMGDFSFDMDDFGGDDGDLGISKGEALTVNSIENSANNVVNITSSVGQAVAETTAKSAEMITKNQQNIYTMNTVNSYKMFNEINSLLGDMGTNIRGLFAYTSNTTEFYNSSLKLNEAMSNRMNEMVALNKEVTEMQRNKYKEYDKSKEFTYEKTKHEEVFDSQGAMNFGKYFEYIMDNGKKAWEGSMLGSQMGMFGDDSNPLLGLAGSPLQFLPKMLLNKMTPKDLKQSMKSLDTTMAGFFKSGMLKVSSNLKQKGETNPIFEELYKIFGINIGTTASIRTGQYVKGAVPLDGIMRQSIVEVMPGYLRVIAAAVTGMNEKVYNYDTGKFEELKNINKMSNNIEKGAYTKVDDTAYKVKSAIDQTFSFEPEIDKVIKNDTDKFFKFLADKGYFFNPRKTTYDDLTENGLFLQDDKSFDLIQSVMKMLGPNAWQELNDQVIESTQYSKTYFQDINKRLTETGLSSIKNGLSDPNGKNINTGLKPLDKFNLSSLDYLRDIRTILLEGIKVFFAGESNTTSSTLTRSKSYNESEVKKKSGSYNRPFDLEEASASAKTDGKVFIENFTDIESDPIKLQKMLADKFDANKAIKRTEEEEKAKALRDSVTGTSLGESFGKLKGVGKELFTAPGKVVSGLFKSVNAQMISFLYGKDEKSDTSTNLMDSIKLKIENAMNVTSEWLNDKIIEPLNEFLFDPANGLTIKLKESFSGLKNKAFGEFYNGSSKGGWFSPVINGFLDTKDMMINGFIGKEYTNRTTGSRVPKRESNVMSEMKNIFSNISASIKGDRTEGSPSMLDKIYSGLQLNLGKFSNTLFGTTDITMTPTQFYNANIKQRISKIGLGALAGVGLSFISPLGILGGTLLGGSIGTLNSSERFKTKMFGDVGDDGDRKGGVIPKSYLNMMKNSMPNVIKGLGVGALATLISPFGLLGTSLLGGTIGFASSTEKVKSALFGKLGEDGTRDDTFAIIKKSFMDKLKIKLPGMAKGAGLGILGSFFLPGGLIAGSILGLAGGIASQTDTVKSMLFGDLDPDTEKRNGGIFGKLKVWFKGDVMEPMKLFFSGFTNNMSHWFKKSIANPLLDSLEPIKKQAELMKDLFMNNLKAGFESTKEFVGGMFENHVGKPFGKLMQDSFINPLKSFFKNTFGKLGKTFLNVLASPFAGLNKVAMGYKDKHIKNGNADYLDEWKAKKEKRDKDTEAKFKAGKNKFKGNKHKLKLIQDLLASGNYDPNHPATIKALGMMDGNKTDMSNIGNMPKGSNIPNDIPNVDTSADIADNTLNTVNILSDIKGYFKDLFDFSDDKNPLKDKPLSDIPESDNKDKPSKDKSPLGNMLDVDHVPFFNLFKNINIPNIDIKPNKDIPNNISYNSPNMNNRETKTPKAKKDSPLDVPDESDPSNNPIKINPFKNPRKKMYKNIQGIYDKLDDIYSEIKGQLTNVGYNTEMIANILISKFGKPSTMPKGIRAGIHTIKSKLDNPLKMLGKLFMSPFKLIGTLFQPVTTVINEVVKSIVAVPKAILGVVAEVTKGMVSIVSTAFKAVPAIINVIATGLIESTKVMGTIGVEVIKGVGSAARVMGTAIGEVTLGLAKFSAKAIPMLFKTVGFMAKTGASIFAGLVSTAGNLLSIPLKGFNKKNKNNNDTIKDIKNIKTLENVKLIEQVNNIDNLKNIDKINDPQLHGALASIVGLLQNTSTTNNPNTEHPVTPNSPVGNITESLANAGTSILSSIDKIVNGKNKNEDSINKFNNREKSSEEDLNKQRLGLALQEGAKAEKGTFELLNDSVGKKGIFGKIFSVISLLFSGAKLLFGKLKLWIPTLISKIGDLIKKIFPKTAAELAEEGVEVVAKEGVEAVVKNTALNATSTLVEGGLQAGASGVAKNALKHGTNMIAGETLETGVAVVGKKVLTAGAGEIIETGAKTATNNTLNNIPRGASKYGASNLIDATFSVSDDLASNPNIVTKIINSKPVQKLAGSSIARHLGAIGTAVMNKMKNAGTKVFAKMATEWAVVIGSGAVTAGVVPAIWYGGTILNGISATNRMFKISPNYKASVLMRTIAGFSEFISQRISMGFIPSEWLCTLISGLVLSDKEKEAIAMGNDTLKKEHQSYIAQEGIDMTLGDYNTKVANRSLMTKAIDGTKNIGHVLTGNAFNTDKVSNLYGLEENADVSMGQRLGTFGANVGSALTLGTMDASEVKDKASEIWGKTKDFIFGIDDKILDGMDTVNATFGAIFGLTDGEGNPLNLTDWAKHKANAFGDSIKNAVSNTVNYAKDIWDNVSNKYNECKSKTKEAMSTFDSNMGTMLGLVDDSGNSIKLTDWATGKVKSGIESITGVIDSAMKGAKDVWGNVKDMYTKAKEKFKNGAKNFDNTMGKLFGLKDNEGNSTGVTGWVGDKWSNLKQGIDERKKRGNKQGGRGGSGLSMTGPDTKNGAAYFSQKDTRWGSKMYLPDEDIATAGCGPTSAAMVLSSVTGQTILPDEIASYSVTSGHMHPDLGTSWSLFPDLGQKYGIGLNQTNDFDATATALRQGRPVIFSGQGAAPYTTGGHFVVGVGMDNDGRVIINDPISADRSKAYDYNTLLSNTASAWVSNKSLTGGVVSSGGPIDSDAINEGATKESGSNNFLTAMGQIGSLTTGLIGSVISGEVFDADKYLHPEGNNSTVPVAGSDTDGFKPISSDMDFDFGSIAPIGTSNRSNKTYGSDAIRSTPGGNEAFINAIAPQAVRNQAEFGIPASTVIAQAILESGWGKSTIGNNVFGIKEGSGYSGPVVSTKTNEHMGGGNVSITDTFRGYDSISQGIYDHSKNVIAGNPQYYSGVISKDWRQSIRGLSPSYATDPNYVGKLESTINANNLTKFNNMKPEGIGGRGEKPKNNLKCLIGGKGGRANVNQQRLNMQQVISESLRNTNNEINDVLTAQRIVDKTGNNIPYDTIVRLLQHITENTSSTAQNTRELINKEYCVNVEQQQSSILEEPPVSNKDHDNSREGGFSKLVNKGNGGTNVSNAYGKAREYAIGIRD